MRIILNKLAIVTAVSIGLSYVSAQTPVYPSGNPNPSWQSFYEVTTPLPNVTFNFAGRSFAGNIPIQRGANLSLFYWAVESSNGSLTDPKSTAPWHIWLNGGPGSSSFLGFFFENGPIRIEANYSASVNQYSWDKLADTIWVDQPVGVGYSTLQPNITSRSNGLSGWASDEDVVGSDFNEFLANLVQVFPNLANRPLHLLGESYAGTYIPYITKHYFGLNNPPVKLQKIAIGDGVLGNSQVFGVVPTIYVLETLPQIISYDVAVFEYFKEQNHLCGLDVNLTYPQNGKIPTVNLIATPQRLQLQIGPRQSFIDAVHQRYTSQHAQGLIKRGIDREVARTAWKRDLSQRTNGTIDPWYGCDINIEALDYAVNFTYPWDHGGTVDVYNIPSALTPSSFEDASVFMNDPAVRAALHAPNKTWHSNVLYFFGGNGVDPSPEPMVFLDALAANATEKGLSVIIYSGNLDGLVAHRGSEMVIQNTTFGGTQGFTRKPSTPWYNDDGTFAGIVHQERNWTYVLFQGAGHLVPMQQPAEAYTFVREFIVGNNQTGLVTSQSVVGGEDPRYIADILPAGPDIYTGSYATEGTTQFPSATINQWNSFLAIETNTITLTPFAGQGTGVSIGYSLRLREISMMDYGVVLFVYIIFQYLV